MFGVADLVCAQLLGDDSPIPRLILYFASILLFLPLPILSIRILSDYPEFHTISNLAWGDYETLYTPFFLSFVCLIAVSLSLFLSQRFKLQHAEWTYTSYFRKFDLHWEIVSICSVIFFPVFLLDLISKSAQAILNTAYRLFLQKNLLVNLCITTG